MATLPASETSDISIFFFSLSTLYNSGQESQVEVFSMDKKTRDILLGPLAFALVAYALNGVFSFKAAVAMALTVWMGLWVMQREAWAIMPAALA